MHEHVVAELIEHVESAVYVCNKRESDDGAVRCGAVTTVRVKRG